MPSAGWAEVQPEVQPDSNLPPKGDANDSGPDPRSTAPKERSVVLEKAPPNHETGDHRNQIVYDPADW